MHHLLSPRGRDESEPCLKSSNPIRNQFADEESGLVFGTSVRTKTLKQEVWMLLWCLHQGFMCFLIAGGSIVTGKSFTPTHVCNVCYLWAKPFSTQLMKIFQIRQHFVLGSPEPTPTVGFFPGGNSLIHVIAAIERLLLADISAEWWAITLPLKTQRSSLILQKHPHIIKTHSVLATVYLISQCQLDWLQFPGWLSKDKRYNGGING